MDHVPTTNPPDPGLERLRYVHTAAHYFGHDRRARVTSYDGAVYTGKGLWVFYDELIVGAPWRSDAIHLPLAIVARIERDELRLGRAVLAGVSIAAVGALLGAGRDFLGGDPLGYHDGLLLGAILGSVAAPFAIWLAQGVAWFKHWRVVLDERAI